jgi:hypothetical protein
MNKFLIFFQKSGLIKLTSSFILMALFAWLYDITNMNVFKYLFFIPTVYVMLAAVLFFGAAFYNTIKDFINKKR